MATAGIAPGVIIGLREGVEAALVVGIILGYLVKIGRPGLRRYVYGGTAAAFAASAGLAGGLFLLGAEFEGNAESAFEGTALVLAVIVLTSMVFWMMKASKSISQHVQKRIDSYLDGSQLLGLVALSFLVVFREGVETALLMFGAGAETSAADATIGVGLGLLIAGVLGVGIMRLSWRIPLHRFFQITGIALVVIGAGLFATGVHEYQAAFGWTFGNGLVYDLRGVFSAGPENPLGYLLRGIVGYSDAPTILESMAYAAYWSFTAIVFLGIRSGKVSVVVEPFRRFWRSLVSRDKTVAGETP
ncbi:MAG TPA: FTR1 family protein [Thermoplasmata archaeon]|nr:FTR1 family protein [Thermoplasmata archaeon]